MRNRSELGDLVKTLLELAHSAAARKDKIPQVGLLEIFNETTDISKSSVIISLKQQSCFTNSLAIRGIKLNQF